MLNGIGWGGVLSGTEVTAVTSDEDPVDALIVVAISPSDSVAPRLVFDRKKLFSV